VKTGKVYNLPSCTHPNTMLMNAKNDLAANEWQQIKADKFWRKVALRKPVFQVYENEEKFLDVLLSFVGAGINCNDCTIVIATDAHQEKLQKRLASHGVHVEGLIREKKYIPVHAESALARFMRDGLPHEQLFINTIKEFTQEGASDTSSIRIFREMGPVLLAQGNEIAAMQLEVLWKNYSDKMPVSLFCAYPKAHSVIEDCDSLREMGYDRTKMVTNSKSLSELLYKECMDVMPHKYN